MPVQANRLLWARRISRSGYLLLFIPVHLFLIAVVIAAAVTWVSFIGSFYVSATVRANWLPAYPLGPLDPDWVKQPSTIVGPKGELVWISSPPPLYGSAPIIDDYMGFIRVKQGRFHLSYQKLSTSIWVHGHELDEMPDSSPAKVSGSYSVIPSTDRFRSNSSPNFVGRLGFFWKSEGKVTSAFGYFSHLHSGATDMIDRQQVVRIGFPLWLPGIMLTLVSFIYLRQRRRGWVRWRRKRNGLCLGCGYSRRGISDDSGCPECGALSPS